MGAERVVWPELPVAGWRSTRDTFQLWLQVVGKVKMARVPLVNHWWATTLKVTSAGLSTGLIPAGRGRGFSIDLDLVDHELVVRRTDGTRRRLELVPMPVRSFYAELSGILADLDLTTHIWPVPVEIPDAIPFAEDDVHDSYDAAAVTAFWCSLVEADRVLEEFRARFVGKCSPVHLFWGALDLAVTRFSGRPAPAHPGGAPNCGPHVMHEAYSHEVSSAGYWPGGEGEGIFYFYAYPEPASGYRDAALLPAEARWDDELQEFVLPYTAVRTADDPDRVLTDFLQSTYEAAADAAGWGRQALERDRPGPHVPPELRGP